MTSHTSPGFLWGKSWGATPTQERNIHKNQDFAADIELQVQLIDLIARPAFPDRVFEIARVVENASTSTGRFAETTIPLVSVSSCKPRTATGEGLAMSFAGQ